MVCCIFNKLLGLKVLFELLTKLDAIRVCDLNVSVLFIFPTFYVNVFVSLIFFIVNDHWVGGKKEKLVIIGKKKSFQRKNVLV